MIDMGSATACPPLPGDCNGVVIEHLGLNANSEAGVNGIVNLFSQELSNVNDVALTQFVVGAGGTGGIGLTLGAYPSSPDCSPGNGGSCTGDSNNSGPYTNISYQGNAQCVNIKSVSTRGIHGLTCAMSNLSGPAILLDGPNNTLDDVTITNQGGTSGDGILIGPPSTTQYQYTFAHANVVMNVNGTHLSHVVHISSHTSPNSYCPPGSSNGSSVNDVCDLTLQGIVSSSSSYSIDDELTSTMLTDTSVAMYVLGEQTFVNNSIAGNSRLTTSPSVPTWIVGTSSASAANAPCVTGSLFSCTGTGGVCADTIYGCAGGKWAKILQ
jgi:hypothetical protein